MPEKAGLGVCPYSRDLESKIHFAANNGEVKGMQTLLIVEDNAAFRQIIREAMEAAIPEARIIEAQDGKTAQDAFAREKPKAVFVDLNIPSPSGFMVINWIKAKDPNCLVVVLSNHDGEEYREASESYGADHFISKDNVVLKELKELVINQFKETGK